jgi:hypothetical protein
VSCDRLGPLGGVVELEHLDRNPGGAASSQAVEDLVGAALPRTSATARSTAPLTSSRAGLDVSPSETEDVPDNA